MKAAYGIVQRCGMLRYRGRNPRMGQLQERGASCRKKESRLTIDFPTNRTWAEDSFRISGGRVLDFAEQAFQVGWRDCTWTADWHIACNGSSTIVKFCTDLADMLSRATSWSNGWVFTCVPRRQFLFLSRSKTRYHIAGSSLFWVIAVTARMPAQGSNKNRNELDMFACSPSANNSNSVHFKSIFIRFEEDLHECNYHLARH